jgi:transcription elongation GreA/GreB family factor
MHTFVLASPLLSTATTTESHLTMAVVEDTQSACRLSESERTLHASKQAQQRLQQQLAECKAELEEASVRADAAHSEALSYLSKVRQQDRQAQLDRSVCEKSPISLSLCFVHATEAMIVVKLDPSVPIAGP